MKTFLKIMAMAAMIATLATACSKDNGGNPVVPPTPTPKTYTEADVNFVLRTNATFPALFDVEIVCTDAAGEESTQPLTATTEQYTCREEGFSANTYTFDYVYRASVHAKPLPATVSRQYRFSLKEGVDTTQKYDLLYKEFNCVSTADGADHPTFSSTITNTKGVRGDALASYVELMNRAFSKGEYNVNKSGEFFDKTDKLSAE